MSLRPGKREEILELVAAGRLAPAEADALLRRLERRGAWWGWLVNPLERTSTTAALVASIAGAVAGLGLSRIGVRFDGALDLHATLRPVPVGVALLDLAVAWPLFAAVLWGVGRLAARRGRFVDHLNAVGLARIPYVGGAAVLAALEHQQPLLQRPVPAITAIALGVATPLLVWFITVLVLGFRTVTGLRGFRLAGSFVAAVVVASILGELLLGLAT